MQEYVQQNSMSKEDRRARIRDRLDKPVVLIGMMGVGKTKLGRDLSHELKVPFIDSDDEIENAAAMSVPDIFERFGEAYFRSGEHRVIKRLIDGTPKVLSTGGGAVMTAETADIIWENTISIWIEAGLEDILKRTMHNREKRPLLMKDNPEQILKDLIETRTPVYQKADIHVLNSFDQNSGDCIEDILNKLGQVLEI